MSCDERHRPHHTARGPDLYRDVMGVITSPAMRIWCVLLGPQYSGYAYGHNGCGIALHIRMLFAEANFPNHAGVGQHGRQLWRIFDHWPSSLPVGATGTAGMNGHGP